MEYQVELDVIGNCYSKVQKHLFLESMSMCIYGVFGAWPW